MCTTEVYICLEVYAFQVKSKKQGKEPMVLVRARYTLLRITRLFPVSQNPLS